MPHFDFKILPTVDELKTQTLNQAAISISQSIRYVLDSAGQSLIQKGGGWARWFATALPSVCKALWGWQDITNGQWLAAGCTNTGGSGGPLLILQASGTSVVVTPKVIQDNPAVSVTTNTTDNSVIITDTGSNISSFDTVFIQTHIAVSNVVIFGQYECQSLSANTYTIFLHDIFGNPVQPNSAVTGGVVENFTTLISSNVVTVTLPNHNLTVGATFSVLIKTTLGGITLQGDYLVEAVLSSSTFTILGNQTATATVSNQAINGGNARYNYYLAFGALPLGTGYGIGGYGIGGYGTGSPPTGTAGNPLDTYDWTLDNWNSLLIACSVLTTFGSVDNATQQGGPLYYWDPSGITPTGTLIPNAPISNAGAFVAMPELQIIAYGSTETGTQDPLLIRGCDANDLTTWTSTPTNLAFSKRLTSGSRIVSGLQMAQQLVFLTDLGLWTGQFIGGNDVYSWLEVAKGCGCVAQKAAGALYDNLYWMSQKQFFTFSGAGVEPLPCSVRDFVFDQIDITKYSNVRCAVSSFYNEIAWHFTSKVSPTGQNDMAVKFNRITQGWDTSQNGPNNIARTAWINQTILGPPIGTDSVTNLIFQHEVSNDADGGTLFSSFTTGYGVLNTADVLMFVDQFWPDMKWGQDGSMSAAQLSVTFFYAEYPNGTVRTAGPFTITNSTKFVTPRFRGRLTALQFSSSDVGTFWRLGLPRYRGQEDGKFY